MKLYEHQKEALEKTKNKNHVAFYHDMGLGKTFTGAEKMARLDEKVNLLICQKSKIDDWVGHFKEHYSNYQTLDISKPNGMKCFLSWSQTNMKIVGVINYELAWRRPELLNIPLGTLMLDESSLIQNRKAKQTKFILKLQPKNVILLSGTPTSGKYENLWTQAHLLGWDISERLYNSTYINWDLLDVGGGMKVKVVNKRNPYKNIERLKQKLREHGATFLKTEECFSLPEQNFISIRVKKTSQYTRFMKNSYIEIGGQELVGDTSLTKRLYARQLCGQYNKNKLAAFKELIESTNDRLIVFYNFTAELHELQVIARKESRPFGTVNGAVKDLTAYDLYDNSITFIQYQAGSMGLNLQKANKIIYFTLPERSELFEQSKKRIHRIGQGKPCYYYTLICSGSIENHIHRALKMRKDFTDELFKKI